MKKPTSLRAALTAALPALATDPDKLLVFIDAGSLQSSFVPGGSFEVAYTLNIILTDFAGDPTAVWVPLLMWARVNQSELFDNADRAGAIQFEAELLADDLVDLSIKLPLTERCIVQIGAPGVLVAAYADEPQPEAQLTAPHWQLFLRDQLLAEWDAPAV